MRKKGVHLKNIMRFILGFYLIGFITFRAKASNQDNSLSPVTYSISQIKADNNGDFIPDRMGDTVTIAGRVTVSSRVLLKSNLFISIEDSTAGIFIFQQDYHGPVIKQGDSIKVTGIVSQYAGLTEIASPHISFMDSTNRKDPIPLEMSHHRNEYYEGRLISLKGIVIDKGSNTGGKFLIISRAHGVDSTLMVFVARNSSIPKILSYFSVGEMVRITGVLSQYDFDKTPDDNYQILPRSRSDLTVLEHTASFYLLIIGGITFVVLLMVFLNFLLRRQVVSRTKELQLAKDKAEESDRLKTAFLANMSHEIRTPMNGILGFTELLKEPDLTSKEKDKYVDIIQQSGRRMLETVNDIIEISKIETGLISVNPTSFDVNDVLEGLVMFFQHEAGEKNSRLYIEKMFPGKKKIVTDKHKFESIISNLIKNAIKYTNNGEIKTGFYQSNDAIEFRIVDTGMGISEERQTAIFDRFVQADIEDKKAMGGSGLGLSIAKAYAQAIGGNLWLVRSVPDSGSEFRFKLPLNIYPEFKKRKTDKIHKPHNFLKDLTVLVVEDDEVSYQYLAKLLTNLANEIMWAKDGVEAVEMVKSNPHIDVILMDMLMPNMNGFEATKRIREFNKDIIIIAQTALALAGEMEEILASGCNDYISKPVFLARLKEVLSKYF